jgi:7-cyano-7-deazaguanine reductase
MMKIMSNTINTTDLLDLTHLGHQSQVPVDQVETVPWHGGPITVRLECSEFTSLCPVTRQPDFAELVIEYEPGERLIETKSLKLYLWRFRDRAAFNEVLVDEIAQDLFTQSQARRLVVTGKFHARGGIALTATAMRPVPETAPPAPE